MENVNQAGLNELSQNELTQIEGGHSNLLRDAANTIIDIANRFGDFHISHFS